MNTSFRARPPVTAHSGGLTKQHTKKGEAKAAAKGPDKRVSTKMQPQKKLRGLNRANIFFRIY